MENEMDTMFSIEDVQATLETENNRERVEVTPGEYVCEIKAPLPDVRQDAKGHNKILMPIEITGNPQFDGQTQGGKVCSRSWFEVLEEPQRIRR